MIGVLATRRKVRVKNARQADKKRRYFTCLGQGHKQSFYSHL